MPTFYSKLILKYLVMNGTIAIMANMLKCISLVVSFGLSAIMQELIGVKFIIVEMCICWYCKDL
jgi:hypothetical protein